MLFCSDATSLNQLEAVICSHVIGETFELPVRRSHVIEDCIRGLQRRLFSPQKTLVVSPLIMPPPSPCLLKLVLFPCARYPVNFSYYFCT